MTAPFDDMANYWIVLETRAQKTLALADSLRVAGYEVWAPVRAVKKRLPRSNVKREIVVSMLPRYVFARGSQIFDLFAEAANPIANHPQFRVAKWAGIVPRIPDRDFEAMRRNERRNRPEKAARMFRQDDRVKTPEGPFAGLPGVVKSGRRRWTMVLFPNFPIAVKIDTSLLVEDVEAKLLQ
jgi:transcription antitermination factor NusG